MNQQNCYFHLVDCASKTKILALLFHWRDEVESGLLNMHQERLYIFFKNTCRKPYVLHVID